MVKISQVAQILLGVLFFCQLAHSQNETKISIDKKTHDFGSIQESGGLVSHTFVVKNEGTSPLTINQIMSSCDCITSNWPKEAITAGSTGSIEVYFKPEGRPGIFENTVSIQSNGSKSPLTLTLKANVIPSQTEPINFPVFTPNKNHHDFGLIQEVDGFAEYTFIVKNTGAAPLIISHVQSSCGCAEPDWTVEPIQPGKEGRVTIIYDPTNRPGPFKKNIAVYTNEPGKRHRLSIEGDVIPKPRDLQVYFHDSIGSLRIQYTSFLFYTIRPGEISTQEVWIQNASKEELKLSVENVPEYLEVIIPENLSPGSTDRFKISLLGSNIDMKGRLISSFPLKTISASGKTIQKTITVATNFIDDFSNQSTSEKMNGPSLQLSTKNLEYGKVKKGGFLGLGSKRVYKELTISNVGKKTLTLHSVTADDEKVEVTGFNKRTLEPKESITLRIFIDPKDINGFFVTDLYVICNDPKAPIHEVRISAER